MDVNCFRSGIVVLLHGVAAVCTEYVFQVEGLLNIQSHGHSLGHFLFNVTLLLRFCFWPFLHFCAMYLGLES